MANTVYANKVIEAKAKDLLLTAVNTRNLMTVDSSLVATPGMTKTINVYTYTGTAEELAAGKGNTVRGSIAYEGKDYTVKMVQQAFDYQDEDFMKDNTIVDNMLKGANQTMVNKMTADFLVEAKKATVKQEFAKGATISYDVIVDAISKLNFEDESKLFIVIPNSWKAALRKDDDYKAARMGEVVYNGQVGTICGIPVIASKALEDDATAYVMTNEAITLFMKKDVEIEQDRDVDTRTNSVYERTAYVCALTDATKICKIVEAAA